MRNKLSNTLWGLFFILIGVGFAGRVLFDWDFSIFFPGWWTLFIIIPCFISMLQKGFGTGSTIGFIVGVLLLASNYVDLSFNVWRLMVPAILIFIGLRIMFQNSFRKKPDFTGQYNYTNTDTNTSSNTYNNTDGGQEQTYTGGAKADYNAIFSGNRIRVTDTFTGASLNAVFGGLTLDLRDARIVGNVEISAQAIFGGIDIYVPTGVNVKVNNVPVFGGVSNKTVNSYNPEGPTIYMNSTCMFGGIDIK